MKTHDFANALQLLAAALKSRPNVELNRALDDVKAPSNRMDNQRISVGLSTLVGLSKVDKQQWINLVKEHGFPIDIRPRDASRDILGKVLTYLEKNTEARKRLASSARKVQSDQVSGRLLQALGSLLSEE